MLPAAKNIDIKLRRYKGCFRENHVWHRRDVNYRQVEDVVNVPYSLSTSTDIFI